MAAHRFYLLRQLLGSYVVAVIELVLWVATSAVAAAVLGLVGGIVGVLALSRVDPTVAATVDSALEAMDVGSSAAGRLVTSDGDVRDESIPAELPLFARERSQGRPGGSRLDLPVGSSASVLASTRPTTSEHAVMSAHSH